MITVKNLEILGTVFVYTWLGVTGSNFEMKSEPRHPPTFGLHREVRAGHAEWSVHYSSGDPRGVTGSNFEMKPERRRMPGFGLHFEVRAGHAEPSVQVPQVWVPLERETCL